jgi:hypothetical protein
MLKNIKKVTLREMLSSSTVDNLRFDLSHVPAQVIFNTDKKNHGNLWFAADLSKEQTLRVMKAAAANSKKDKNTLFDLLMEVYPQDDDQEMESKESQRDLGFSQSFSTKQTLITSFGATCKARLTFTLINDGETRVRVYGSVRVDAVGEFLRKQSHRFSSIPEALEAWDQEAFALISEIGFGFASFIENSLGELEETVQQILGDYPDAEIKSPYPSQEHSALLR